MNFDNIAIAVILILGLIGNNNTVSISATILLLIKLLGLTSWLPYIENNGIFIGIVCLTVAVLAPLAQGRTSISMAIDAFKTGNGLIAIVIGILVSWLAAQGVSFLKETPTSVSALIVGTIIGVCFFKGLAAGPLIAAGMVSMIVSFLDIFQK